MSSRNNQLQNLPEIPWWAIILGFMFLPPAGIVLLLLKIFKESKPNPQRRTQPPEQTATFGADSQQAPVQRPQTVSKRYKTAGSYTPMRSFPYVKLKSGKLLTIAGAAIAGLFGFCTIYQILEWGFYFPEELFPFLVFTCIGAGMLLWGRFRAGQTKKFKRYLARISNEPLIPLRPLAESLPAEMDEVCDTIQTMIDMGVFGDKAYLDMSTETLVVNGAVARPTPAPKPKAEPAKESEVTSEDKILREIRDANDRIPDEQISRKIDRIEEITRHILRYLKKHPERSSELHTFLDYYLPTTLKMLNTYAELDAQQLDGENIAATKKRIEGILDKVVEGFELQLDKLFEGDMLDISSDIDVMEKMLQRDGLSGEMKIPKAPKTPEASGYTPTLTLDPDQPGSGMAAAPAPQEEKRSYDDLGMW